MSIDLARIATALRVVLALVGLLMPTGAAGAAEEPPEDRGELAEWARGPVRWLLLEAERRELRRVSSRGAALGFIERFWARRDPDPAVEGNPYRETFARLVEAADLLYEEDGLRGSLTDRGRVLVLLGAPTGLRVSSREALEWDPSTGDDGNVRVRYQPLEVWTYEARDLPRPLRLALRVITDETTFRVSFIEESGRTSLSEGEELLVLAAKAALAL